MSGLQTTTVKRECGKFNGVRVVEVVRGRRENGQDFMTALVTGEPGRILSCMEELHAATVTVQTAEEVVNYTQMRWVPKPSDTDPVAAALVAVKTRRPMGFANAPGDLWPNAEWVWTAVRAQLTGDWLPGREAAPQTPAGGVRFASSAWSARGGAGGGASDSPAASREVTRQLFRGELEAQIAAMSGGAMTTLEDVVKGAMEGRKAREEVQELAVRNAALMGRVNEIEEWKGRIGAVEERMQRAAQVLEDTVKHRERERAEEGARKEEEARERRQDLTTKQEGLVATLAQHINTAVQNVLAARAEVGSVEMRPTAADAAWSAGGATQGATAETTPMAMEVAQTDEDEEMGEVISEEEQERRTKATEAERARLGKLRTMKENEY